MANDITQEMKDWFGQGEADVNLMLALGIVTPGVIRQLWECDPGFPGYVKEQPNGE